MPVKSYLDFYDKWMHPVTFDEKTIDEIVSAVSVAEKKLDNQTCKCKMAGKKSLPGIKQVYFNEKAGTTAIVWADGSKTTVVHCGEGEKFERYIGFCAAVCKKLFKSTSAVKAMIDEKDADLAKKRQEEERQKKAEETREKERKNRERKDRKREEAIRKAFEYIDKLMPTPDVSELIEAMFGKQKEADDAEG